MAKRTMAAAKRLLDEDSATGWVAFFMARYGVGATTAKRAYSGWMNGVPTTRTPFLGVMAARRLALSLLVSGFKAW